MPKQKNNKTMSKRIKVSSTGKALHLRAGRAHKLSGKSPARKRGYSLEHTMAHTDGKTAKKMVGAN